MDQASSFRRKQIDHHLTRGSNERGLALLQEQIADNPQDIKAHLSLASALRRKCDVNGSIAEYRRALALAQASGDVMLQKQAIKALTPLGIMPANLPVVKALSLTAAAQGGSKLQ
jgi:cytochrome c-type biogenesis protein CcmH/NrfG